MKKRGIILISVLWIMVILTTLAVNMAVRIHYRSQLAKNKLRFTESVIALDSAFQYLLLQLETDPDLSVDSYKDLYFNNPSLFKEQYIMDGLGFSVLYFSFEASEWQYGVEPLNNRLNLNLLTQEQKEKILKETEFDQDQFACVFDWIDGDNDPNNQGHGAEKGEYEELDIPYQPSNMPLTNWTELYLIKGMTPEFAAYLKSSFTLWGDGKVNINFPTQQTLSWLGFSESLIDKIKRYFHGIDGIPNTEDDQYFNALDKIEKNLDEFETLYADEVSELRKAIPQLTVASSYFRATVKPLINQSYSSFYQTAILKREKNECHIIHIQEAYE